MADGVHHAVFGKLTLNGILCTACAVAQGIAPLDHEPIHDAMEGQAVVESVLCKLDKVCGRDRRGPFIEFELDRTVVSDCDFRMANFLKGLGRLLRTGGLF